mgnify:FL=1
MSKIKMIMRGFKWAVTSAVYLQKSHPERLDSRMRKNLKKFNLDGIEFPVDERGIEKFEKQNPYKINVFDYDRKSKIVRCGEHHGPNVIN